jgi:hypothetical protein
VPEQESFAIRLAPGCAQQVAAGLEAGRVDPAAAVGPASQISPIFVLPKHLPVVVRAAGAVVAADLVVLGAVDPDLRSKRGTTS